MKNKLIEELRFCLDLWKKQGGCAFGGSTRCESCATPYLIYKLLTGEVVHGKNFCRNWIRSLNLTTT